MCVTPTWTSTATAAGTTRTKVDAGIARAAIAVRGSTSGPAGCHVRSTTFRRAIAGTGMATTDTGAIATTTATGIAGIAGTTIGTTIGITIATAATELLLFHS